MNKYRIVQCNKAIYYKFMVQKRFMLFFWIYEKNFFSFDDAKTYVFSLIEEKKESKKQEINENFIWYPDHELKTKKGSLSICDDNLEGTLTIVEDGKIKKLPLRPLPPKPPPLPKTRSNKFFL